MFAYSAFGSSPAKFSRDLGAVAYGRFISDRLTYFAGAFQGREGSSASQLPVGGLAGLTATSTNAPESTFEYVGRLTYDFLESEGGSGYQGTYFGEKKIFNIGFGAAYQADAAYKNTENVYFYANGPSSTFGDGTQTTRNPLTTRGAVTKVGSRKVGDDAVDYTAIAVDMMFEYPTSVGVPTITAQYLKVDFDDAYETSYASGERMATISGMNGQKEGYYVKAAYLLPFKIGEQGKIQPYVLYEDWDFAHLVGINDQTITQFGGGINYYVLGDQRVRLTAEFLRTEFDEPTPLAVANVATSGLHEDFDTFRMMLQVVF